jgi:ribosomal protein S18 acetylase RimI-like enzyme
MAPTEASALSTSVSFEVRTAVDEDLPAITTLAAWAFDCEPIQRAALADLLFHRPRQDMALRLVAGSGKSVLGFAFGCLPERTGYVDAIAVDQAARRRGIASALLAAMERRLVHAGAESLRAGGNTWFYAWPGVDLGYTAALSMFEHAGYQRTDLAQNMEVPLDRWVPGSAQRVLDRHATGVDVRRAHPADWTAIEAFIQREFTEVWRHETYLAVHRDVPTAFMATRDDRVVGFGCHGVYRRDWFGPLATAPTERGNGIGEALLRLCLDDLAGAGIATAQIGWIGPMSFYSRTVDARCGRQFVMLDKHLAAAAPAADLGERRD